MRGVVRACCLMATLAGCHPAKQSDVASPSEVGPVTLKGKIPITSRSVKAVALYLRARALNENLQPHEGYALFQQAVALDPAFALGEYGLALTAPTVKQAREHLSRALALSQNVSDGERLLLLAMQARSDGDVIASRQRAESLVTRYPDDERAHWGLGNTMLAQQEYNEAVAQFQKAIAINPQFSLAYNSVGYALRPTGNTGAAEKAFLQYIALVPNDPNPYDSYAELLLSMGRFDESIVQYNKALSIDPHFSGSFVGIAANHLLAGRYPSAIAEAERYFNLARDDHERRAALLTLALVYVDSGATDEALRAMEREYNVARAIGDTASMSDDVMSIGHILLEAGRVEAARDRFQHARTLVSASSLSASSKADCELTTHYNLARVALATHDAATAKVEADAFTSGAATRRSGDRVRQAHELNGLLLLEAQHFDRSLAEFTLADQQNPSVLFAMAMAHDGKGERSRADELMTLAIHQYTLPTFPYVFTRAKAKILPGVRPATMRVTLP